MMHDKKLPIIFLSVLIVIVLSVTVIHKDPESYVMNYYERHHEELKAEILRHYEDKGTLSSPVGVTVCEWQGENSIVEYTVKTSGIVSASMYYGFFYSKDNVPVGFQNADEELLQISEGEWKWQDAGDNRGYIKQIEPYWFYFEASL